MCHFNQPTNQATKTKNRRYQTQNHPPAEIARRLIWVGGFKIYSYFHPENFGEKIPFLTCACFSDGLKLNHQNQLISMGVFPKIGVPQMDGL